jgi:hypothetical protein
MMLFLIKKTNLLFYTCYLQGHALDNDVVEKMSTLKSALPTCENFDDGYIHQAWVEV